MRTENIVKKNSMYITMTTFWLSIRYVMSNIENTGEKFNSLVNIYL